MDGLHELHISKAARVIWEDIRFTKTGGEYFQSVIRACQSAKTSIRFETYIFERDDVGNKVLEEMRLAVLRGVSVRLLIDAIGSPGFTKGFVKELAEEGIRVRVFGRLRDLVVEALGKAIRGKLWLAIQTLRKFQLRNHRKLSIFDESFAILGSANIGEKFLDWRETMVRVSGPGLVDLRRSFIRSWRLAAREILPEDRKVRVPEVCTNFTRVERARKNLLLFNLVKSERSRIYLSTAYFHPRPRLAIALYGALLRGVDVRILSPKRSDIPWFPWLSRTIYAGLIEKGAKIYEYEKGMMHAKTSLFSHTAIVGSTNMNYRSFMHDLELDIIFEDEETVKTSEQLFFEDLKSSTLLTPKMIQGYTPLALLVSLILTPLKRWL